MTTVDSARNPLSYISTQSKKCPRYLFPILEGREPKKYEKKIYFYVSHKKINVNTVKMKIIIVHLYIGETLNREKCLAGGL